jgi:hypothetical protein
LEGRPPGEHFPPRLDAAAAERSARADLLGSILRLRSRGAKPTPGALMANHLVHCPLWIYYFPRVRDRLDIRVVDGLTAELLGNRTHMGVLSAFMTHHGAPQR